MEALPSEDLNPYNIAQEQFDAAIEYLPHIPRGLSEWLRGSTRLIKVEFPVECDDGSVVLAGQSHEHASDWSSAEQPAWMERLLSSQDPVARNTCPSCASWVDR